MNTYDVAISLLAQDEAWARQRLLPALGKSIRGEIFLYSRRQEEIASDGDLVMTFGRVFRDARVVVVVYRAGWGKTRFTALEEEAIKSRKLDRGGVRSIYMISMDPPAIPEWFPPIEMYFDPKVWKPSAMAAQVALRVADAGGIIGSEPLAERAHRLRAAERQRIKREQRMIAEGRFQHSQQFHAFVQALVKCAGGLSADEPTDPVSVEEPSSASPHIRVCYRDVSMQVYMPRTSDLLLLVSAYKAVSLAARPRMVENQNLWKREYRLVLDVADQWGWRRGHQDQTSTELAESLVGELLELGHKPEEQPRRAPRRRSQWKIQ